MYHVLTPELANVGDEPVVVTRKKAVVFGKHRINMWSAGLVARANTGARSFKVLSTKSDSKKRPVVARAKRDKGSHPQRWRINTDEGEWVVEVKHVDVYYMTVYPPTGFKLTPRRPLKRGGRYVLPMKQKNGISSHKNLAVESMNGDIAFEIAKQSKGRLTAMWNTDLLNPTISMCLITIVWCHT